MSDDIIIRNATVYDPLLKTTEDRDVGCVNGRMAEPSKVGSHPTDVDANGCLVVPGLIDYHIHVFRKGTLASVDPNMACLPNGVTTCVEGGSAGCNNYRAFHYFVLPYTDVNVKAMLNVSSGGLVSNSVPEDGAADHFERKKIVDLFKEFPGELVALKMRASKGIMKPDESAIRRAISIANECGCNLVVHMTNPSISSEKVAALLRSGDVFCHAFHGHGDTILDERHQIKIGIKEAQERGVIFDACNGCRNFEFSIALPALSNGFKPNIISSDDNELAYYKQPLVSLPRVLSKYLAMGMALTEVIDAASVTPAKLLGLENELGTLQVGTVADIAVFRLKQKPVDFYDFSGGKLSGSEVLVPQMTVRKGEITYSQTDFS